MVMFHCNVCIIDYLKWAKIIRWLHEFKPGSYKSYSIPCIHILLTLLQSPPQRFHWLLGVRLIKKNFMSFNQYSLSGTQIVEVKKVEQSRNSHFKWIVSRNFRWLQMILKDRTWVPGIPLDVYFFIFMFSYSILSLKF